MRVPAAGDRGRIWAAVVPIPRPARREVGAE